ncbi:hypothetical protein M3J09_009435 [Ascochyta lentis]
MPNLLQDQLDRQPIRPHCTLRPAAIKAHVDRKLLVASPMTECRSVTTDTATADHPSRLLSLQKPEAITAMIYSSTTNYTGLTSKTLEQVAYMRRTLNGLSGQPTIQKLGGAQLRFGCGNQRPRTRQRSAQHT